MIRFKKRLIKIQSISAISIEESLTRNKETNLKLHKFIKLIRNINFAA